MNENGTIKKLVFSITINLNEEDYVAFLKLAQDERRKPAELGRIVLQDYLNKRRNTK